MTGTPAKWTDEEVAMLRELAKSAKLSAGAIGLQIGKTRNAIIGKALRLQIRLPGAVGPQGSLKGILKNVRAGKLIRKPVQAPSALKVQPYQPPPRRPSSDAPAWPDMGQSHFRDCQWYHGDPKAGDFSKCNNPTWGASSFCEHHHRRVYVPAQPRQPERSPPWMPKPQPASNSSRT